MQENLQTIIIITSIHILSLPLYFYFFNSPFKFAMGIWSEYIYAYIYILNYMNWQSNAHKKKQPHLGFGWYFICAYIYICIIIMNCKSMHKLKWREWIYIQTFQCMCRHRNKNINNCKGVLYFQIPLKNFNSKGCACKMSMYECKGRASAKPYICNCRNACVLVHVTVDMALPILNCRCIHYLHTSTSSKFILFTQLGWEPPCQKYPVFWVSQKIKNTIIIRSEH